MSFTCNKCWITRENECPKCDLKHIGKPLAVPVIYKILQTVTLATGSGYGLYGFSFPSPEETAARLAHAPVKKKKCCAKWQNYCPECGKHENADAIYKRPVKREFVHLYEENADGLFRRRKFRSESGIKIRHRVYNRDNYKCRNCGTGKNLTIDHIIPISRGGSNEEENLQTLCHSCNQAKGDKMPESKPKVNVFTKACNLK